jgi:maltose alpha-D-glucosyltransferase/alpha-amylase
LIQQYIFNQGSAWDYTLNYLDRFFEDSTRDAAPAGGADMHDGYGALMRTLGQRTAELHEALGRSTGDPAFDPVPIAASEIATWMDRLRAQANEALDRLAKRREALPESARVDTDRLLAERERLIQSIAAHANEQAEGMKTRVHGDYHLGQVLLVKNDFVITDFEGEPTRTMEERSQKQSPLKDVAGMLRSFDYAMHAALFKFVGDRPDTRETVEAAGRQWQRHAVAAFLDGYEDVARRTGLASPRAAKGLLELFVLEKAVYELKYEVDNRPDWVRIPLNGLLNALEGDR